MSFASLGLDRRLLDAVPPSATRSRPRSSPTPFRRRSPAATCSPAPPPAPARAPPSCCRSCSASLGGPRGRVRVLVLTPTRELAAQIDQSRRDLAKFTGTTGAAIYGGVGMGPQETALQEGGRHPRRHAGAPARSSPESVRQARPGRDRRPRRGRPHARHGLPARRAADLRPPAGEAPDAALLGHHAGRDRAARPRDPRDPLAIQIERRSAPAVGITQTVWPVAQELKTALLLELLRPRRARERARLHPHQAPRQPRRRLAREARHQRGTHPRQPQPGAAHRGAGRLQGRPSTASSSPPTSPRAASTSRRCRTSSTSTCRPSPTPTSTASAAPRAPSARATPGPSSAARRRATCAPSSAPSAAARAPHARRLRLHEARRGEARDPDPGAHRGDPRQEGRRPPARGRQGGAQVRRRGRPDGPAAGEAAGGKAGRGRRSGPPGRAPGAPGPSGRGRSPGHYRPAGARDARFAPPPVVTLRPVVAATRRLRRPQIGWHL
jgi:hypothetical protein